MNQQQREQLAKNIEALLRKEWGDEFTDEDVARIHDYCMDEAQTMDTFTEAMQFEMKYG